MTVDVQPDVLRWLRESSGWKKEEVGERLRVPVTVVDELENGKSSPTLRQLENLSKSFKYPLASFFLSKPKKDKPLPQDFRFLQGNKKDEFDRKTILRIRNSRNIQKVSKELASNIKYDIVPKVEQITLLTKPNELASKYRKVLDLDWNKQIKFKNVFSLLRYLRERIETRNILVLQWPMPVDDARGFALTDENPLVIVINSSDTPEAKLFTLMHEFGHVLLRNTVIDMPESQTQNKNEIWCNNFASSFLLPSDYIKESFDEHKNELRETKILNKLSRKHKVSKKTLLIKMKVLRYITETEYNLVMKRWESTDKNQKKWQGGSKDSKPLCCSRMGNKFISLVAKNLDAGSITYADALDYLSVKSKDLERAIIQGC